LSNINPNANPRWIRMKPITQDQLSRNSLI
jgi:hypothetical protein